MTHDQMHRALLEWMGWEFAPGYPCELARNGSLGIKWYYRDECVPDLTLDWLHEVEAKLTDEQHLEFRLWLAAETKSMGKITRNFASASKYQRLEALCSALGLLKEPGKPL